MPASRLSPLRRALVAACAAMSLAVVSLPGAVAAPRLDLDDARRQVESMYHKAEQATERYNDARIALRDAERLFSRAQRRSADQQAKVSTLQKQVGALAAEAYRNGGLDRTLQLVFSTDPDAFLDRASSLDALGAREAAALRQVIEARRELRANQVAASQQLAVVEKQRQTLAKEKSEVEKNLRAARAVLNRLQDSDRARLARASRDNSRDLLKDLPVVNSARAAKAVKFALAQLGDRYVWSAAGPDAWDCSGLTMMAWRQAGVSLPHSSAQQYATGRKIPREALQPGDLVYFYSPISHVALYIGNGQIVDAPNPGKPVQIRPLDTMPYVGATRP
ncbi:MAG: NlpC/P60 family protein [Sporichthyaceae bacterium]